MNPVTPTLNPLSPVLISIFTENKQTSKKQNENNEFKN